MQKLHGAASRIEKGLQHRLSVQARFGQSRHEAKQAAKQEYLAAHNGNLRGWNPSKTEGIYSIKTIEAYRQTANEFARWSADQGVKNANQVTRDLAAKYLKERQASGKSAWTYSKDMSALNKLYNFGLSKKELGLQERHGTNITRSRGTTANDGRDTSAYQDQKTFAQGCGCRRESVTTVTPADCIRNSQGTVVAVHLIEKGGKERVAPVLNEYKDELTRIVNLHTQAPDKPLFFSYDSHIDNHAFRGEYATKLLSQLESEKAANAAFFGGDFDVKELVHLRGRDKLLGETYKGHDTILCAAVSGALGHNRLEIIFSNYIR